MRALPQEDGFGTEAGAMTRTTAERNAIKRDGPTCLRCGRDLVDFPASVHHRLPRSAGTKAKVDVLSNLVVVCGTGTSPHCHAWIHQHPAEAYATGWLMWRGECDPPESIPLVDIQGREFFLTDDGGVIYTGMGETG